MRIDWSEFSRALPKEEKLEPRLEEKNNYRVPYFVRNRLVCFIWPVSAPNAPKAKNQKWKDTIVSLGFCYGHLLSNDQGLLLSEGRKQVYIVRLQSMKQLAVLEIPIKEIIQEAVLVDETFSSKKRK